MELLSVIRRWRYRDHFSIREISRRTGLSRNTVRKYLRSDSVEPKFNVARPAEQARSLRRQAVADAAAGERASRASRSGRSSNCTPI